MVPPPPTAAAAPTTTRNPRQRTFSPATTTRTSARQSSTADERKSTPRKGSWEAVVEAVAEFCKCRKKVKPRQKGCRFFSSRRGASKGDSHCGGVIGIPARNSPPSANAPLLPLLLPLPHNAAYSHETPRGYACCYCFKRGEVDRGGRISRGFREGTFSPRRTSKETAE